MAFTATTTNSAAAWRPDLFTFEPAQAVPEALIVNHTTVSGVIEGDAPSLKVAYCVDDSAEFVDEGADIGEAEPELNEAIVYTRKFAQLLRITREQYRQAGTAEELARSVARAMTIKADAALIAQAAPTAPAVAPVAGLVNVAGISSQTAVSGSLDKLVDLEAAVRAAGGEPSAWILAPTAWAKLRKLKLGTDYNAGLLGAGTEDSAPRLLSIPVVLNAQVPASTGLLIDRTAIISAVSQVEIATSADLFFGSDSIAVRATMRTGHVVPRPARIGKFVMS